MPAKLPKELARLGVLAVAAAWLLHPFATARMYGAGDALWYANMLADYVTQLRAGNFPVFAGQTQYAFNGAVYPLRVAPMYQHLAGLLDQLTGRSLGFFALQHLAVIVCGVAGIFACYLTLGRMAPGRRWCAAGLAILYLSCPGLLATIYTQDLYMTWMAVPLAPMAAYGIWRTFHRDDVTSQFWLAVPLAALWWAHAPIALWFSFIGAGSQVVRLLSVNRGWPSVRRAAFGVAVFALLAQYPFVSVSEVQTPGRRSTVLNEIAHPEQVPQHVREAFPAAILPLSEHARELGDVQLGYALWVILFASVFGAATLLSRELVVLLACSALLLLLLLPIPGLNPLLWREMPPEVVRITYYWPMQRFYLILAALLAAAGQIAFEHLSTRGERMRAALAWVLAACCAWSLWESRQFMRAAAERTASAEVTERNQRPENLFLTNDSYGLFGSLPPYFSNGVMNPLGQARLLSPATGQRLPAPDRRILASGPLSGTVDANPGVLRLGASVHLDPGRRYALEFAFERPGIQGVLQFSGTSMFREYSLPSSGEALAFGSGPGNAHRIALWTSDPAGDDVTLRFIPTAPGEKPEDFERFGSYRLVGIDPDREPVDVRSLMPFGARVRSDASALLETPRMYMPGYLATVDGRPASVSMSQAGLAAVQVPAGTHSVSVWFRGRTLLRASYVCAILAWAGVAILAALASFRALAPARS
jgi:hypothetical protein